MWMKRNSPFKFIPFLCRQLSRKINLQTEGMVEETKTSPIPLKGLAEPLQMFKIFPGPSSGKGHQTSTIFKMIFLPTLGGSISLQNLY